VRIIKIGKIRIKTLRQILEICYDAIEKNRMLKVGEIVQRLQGSTANAYNYQRFLRSIFPDGPFDEDRPAGDEQKCLM
jgi:hypothetical protein